MSKPLVDKSYLLEKFPGKGGWTYTMIPEILQSKNTPFGWVKVKGSIDGVTFQNYHLMPMGNGHLFLPVKAEVRKKIGKQAGDRVHVILYEDNSAVEVPEEFVLCLKDEPKAYKNFIAFTDGDQKAYVEWIYSAKKEETKIERMAAVIERASRNLRLRDKD